MMGEFVTVAGSDEVGPATCSAFDAGDKRIAIANVDGTLYAFDDECTHAKCSLAEGELDGTSIFCPCHGSAFDVTTGDVESPPAKEPLGVYPVRVQDGKIQVEI